MGDRIVSVVVPALNEEHYLPILLRSLGEQEGVRLEVIVVEGHSDDRTVEVAKQTMASRNPNVDFRIYTVDVRNVSYQRNYGVRQSHGALLLFLDSDVMLHHKHWVRDLMERFDRSGALIVSGRFKPIEKHWLARLNYFTLYLFHKTMQYITPYAMGAMLITRRDIYDQVGGFDERLTLNEDANFVKRIAKLGRFRVLPQVCYVSARRFIRGGYFKTSFKYLRIFLNRTIHGENTDTHGYWKDQTYEKRM